MTVGHLGNGVLQAEKAGHHGGGHKGHAAGLDGAGGVDVAAAVLGAALFPFEQQGPAVLFQHRHALGSIVDDGDPQVGEHRRGHIQVAAGPEGYGGIRQRQDTFLSRHEVYAACGPDRSAQLKEQQNAQQSGNPALFHAHPSFNEFQNIIFYHRSAAVVKRGLICRRLPR